MTTTDAAPSEPGSRRAGRVAPASPVRLTWRGAPVAPATLSPGEHDLGVGEDRDGRIYVPRGLRGPAPLLVMLHGAGGDASKSMPRVVDLAAQMRFVVLAPDSRDGTWDAIGGEFGPDVRFLDHALHTVSRKVRIDPKRVALAGFSDGASYALSLGRPNGDLFNALIALSPGFVVEAPAVGQPPVFIVHGVGDRVLPIDATSRQLVPQLREQGYDVTYSEFDGGHALRPAQMRRAVEWWLRRRGR